MNLNSEFFSLVSAWDNGTLNEVIKTGRVINLSGISLMMQQYIKDTKTAADRGFNSIFSNFDHALNAYVLAEQETQVSIFILHFIVQL